MTALLLHGCASGIYSSRRIAKAAVERADFMMIVAGDPSDFRTIWSSVDGTRNEQLINWQSPDACLA